MFQSNRSHNDAAFNLVLIALKAMFNPHLKKDQTPWNMNDIYRTKGSCSWNSPDLVGKECMIVDKNDEIAIVVFVGIAGVREAHTIYRLEDLEVHEPF